MKLDTMLASCSDRKKHAVNGQNAVGGLQTARVFSYPYVAYYALCTRNPCSRWCFTPVWRQRRSIKNSESYFTTVNTAGVCAHFLFLHFLSQHHDFFGHFSPGRNVWSDIHYYLRGRSMHAVKVVVHFEFYGASFSSIGNISFLSGCWVLSDHCWSSSYTLL